MFSRSTFNKYLTSLKYKGIVASIEKYVIEDDMLKNWLQYKKEVNGFFPI